MKKWVTMLVVGLMLAVASTAYAQDDQPRTKFYNFDDMLIDGQFKKPDIMATKAREKADFQRLLKLKKSFLPRVKETGEEDALQ